MDGQMGGQTSQPRCSYLPPIDWHSSSPKLLSRPAFICLKTCLYLSKCFPPTVLAATGSQALLSLRVT